MRELAYIETIKDLQPIPGADKIEVATILGWEVVVKKGEFSVGDKVIYAEIDSVLPDLPPFEFLRQKKFRIRTIKLKSQISQGIAFSLSVINEINPSFNISKLKVGQGVTEILQITKYDPEAALDIAPEVEPQVKKNWLSRKMQYCKWLLFGYKPIKNYGDFPSCCPKTDEMRVQHMQEALERDAGMPVYITEKIDGTSSTFIFRKNGNWLARIFGRGYTFQVCSRNRILFSTDKNHNKKPDHPIMKMADKYNLLSGMKKLNRNLAIQGETIGGPGPNIQGNLYKLNGFDLKVFLIYDIDAKKYLPLDEMQKIIEELHLSMVPLIGTDVINPDIKYWVELSKGNSKVLPSVLREGIVMRGQKDDFSFKAINPLYLLKNELSNK